VRDAYYSGANNDVIFQVIAGTPAGSPTAPALPANSISLATIAVGAAVTQINSGNITDTRVAVTTNLPSNLPSQTGNAGKYLTTNGSITSWATVTATESPTPTTFMLMGA
jgi:hypothetical protein